MRFRRVVHHGHDQGAEDGAHHRPPAAGHAGAAHDDGGDGVHLKAAAGAGVVHRADAGSLNDGGPGHQQPRKGIDRRFTFRTLTPERRVVRSLEPMANTYRPKVVCLEIRYITTAAMAQYRMGISCMPPIWNRAISL